MQYKIEQDEIENSVQLALNKVCYCLSSDHQVDDKSGYVSLGDLLLNGPCTAEDLNLVLYCYTLLRGGFDIHTVRSRSFEIFDEF